MFSRLNLQHKIKDNRGSVLLMTLLVLTSALTVAFGAASVVMSGIIQNRIQERSTKAFFAAETGAERTLWEIRKNGAALDACVLNDYISFDVSPAVCISSKKEYNLSNDASYNVQKLSSETAYSSLGFYKTTRRNVEISY